MSDQYKGILGVMQESGPVTIDPTDPRTWWTAQFSQRKNVTACTAQGPDHIMAMSGIAPRKFHSDPVAHMAAEAAVSAYYQLDGLMLGEDVYNFEAEALGQKMIYGESMPTIDFREPLIATPADLSKLKVPANWLERGRLQYMAEISRRLAGMGAANGMFCAPFSLAVGLRTYPKLMRDIKRDPAFAHELFACLTDEILPSYLKTLSDYSGFKVFNGADAWGAYPNVNPELAEEWIVPYNMRLSQNCAKSGLTVMAVASGDYCEEDPTKFDKNILFKCFDTQIHNVGGAPIILLGMGRWQDYPLEAVAEYLNHKGLHAMITAGINARMLRDGPVSKIVDFVKRVYRVLGHEHNVAFFLASTPADTPADHVHAAVSAVHTYGKLPLAEDVDQIPFEIPQRETFQEYVATMTGGKGFTF